MRIRNSHIQAAQLVLRTEYPSNANENVVHRDGPFEYFARVNEIRQPSCSRLLFELGAGHSPSMRNNSSMRVRRAWRTWAPMNSGSVQKPSESS